MTCLFRCTHDASSLDYPAQSIAILQLPKWRQLLLPPCPPQNSPKTTPPFSPPSSTPNYHPPPTTQCQSQTHPPFHSSQTSRQPSSLHSAPAKPSPSDPSTPLTQLPQQSKPPSTTSPPSYPPTPSMHRRT